ncbi:hypothetical protein COO60DRAFT_1182531 [Scenedesmus sp. NREL 46B-D3]|nr:hypothetical protein COO60DRAFT_1182531 [Scenedesmus sp. NREL 46B-D3]
MAALHCCCTVAAPAGQRASITTTSQLQAATGSAAQIPATQKPPVLERARVEQAHPAHGDAPAAAPESYCACMCTAAAACCWWCHCLLCVQHRSGVPAADQHVAVPGTGGRGAGTAAGHAGTPASVPRCAAAAGQVLLEQLARAADCADAQRDQARHQQARQQQGSMEGAQRPKVCTCSSAQRVGSDGCSSTMGSTGSCLASQQGTRWDSQCALTALCSVLVERREHAA